MLGKHAQTHGFAHFDDAAVRRQLAAEQARELGLDPVEIRAVEVRERGEGPEAAARAALIRLDPLWDELFPAEQARIVTLLVERVEIGMDGLNVRLRMDGLAGLAREMAADMGEAA